MNYILTGPAHTLICSNCKFHRQGAKSKISDQTLKYRLRAIAALLLLPGQVRYIDLTGQQDGVLTPIWASTFPRLWGKRRFFYLLSGVRLYPADKLSPDQPPFILNSPHFRCDLVHPSTTDSRNPMNRPSGEETEGSRTLPLSGTSPHHRILLHLPLR